MKTLVFLLEEASAREMLKSLLPRLFSELPQIKYIVFEGKSDLERELPKKLQRWLTPDTHFVVVRDQDRGDCKAIKAKLRQKCIAAGKPDALIRIVCRELESWYLGDLQAVGKALELPNLSRHQEKSNYRDPDRLAFHAAEDLKRLTNGKYRKISGSREIGKYLSLEGNRSHSFNVFIDGLNRLVA